MQVADLLFQAFRKSRLISAPSPTAATTNYRLPGFVRFAKIRFHSPMSANFHLLVKPKEQAKVGQVTVSGYVDWFTAQHRSCSTCYLELVPT